MPAFSDENSIFYELGGYFTAPLLDECSLGTRQSF